MKKYDDFPKEYWSKIEQEVLPVIALGLQKVLTAHEVDPDYFDNYTIGTNAYRNIHNRMVELCAESTFFSGYARHNSIEVCADVDGVHIAFRVPRVNPKTAIPTSSKGLKISLIEQFFLCEELHEIVAHRGAYILGFEIDSTNGIGDIKFCQLTAVDRKTFQANIIATFRVDLSNNSITTLHSDSSYSTSIEEVFAPMYPVEKVGRVQPEKTKPKMPERRSVAFNKEKKSQAE